ncbi:MAG: hypothetical protein AAFY56_07370 [Pseudomonadota bacterium]
MLLYAVNDSDVQYTGRLSLHVGIPPDMEQVGELPGIVILQPYNEPTGFLIGFCDDTWAVQGVVGTNSLEQAKHKAATYYAGIESKWIESPYSEDDIREFLVREYDVDPDTEWWA